ncbi:translation initiation factor IF-2 N-terminal domain-containing protein [Rhodococcus sp. NPDC049939]|uniref:translation initiation factor IF-2 N-terminal domain-containing protein n=1 Tax=Rhodococcus sp. NPDC049939 TaxID=3155511 RepID=UPI0033F7A37C
MADQAPPTNSEPNDMATAQSAVPDLPEKIRVHALAKMLGVTSKQVLAEAAALGIELRSAQSSLQRDIALQVHAAFTPGEPAPTEAEPTVEAAAEPTVEAAAEPTVEAAAEPTVEPEAEPTVEAAAEPTVEPEAEPTGEPVVEVAWEPVSEQPASAEPDVGTALFRTGADESGVPAVEQVPTAAPAISQVPLFLQPDPSVVESQPRRRRGSRDVGTSDSAAEQPAVEERRAAPDSSVTDSSVTDSRVTEPRDTRSADTESEESEVEGDQPRRRRRGRRGRGRGRGEQHIEQGAEPRATGESDGAVAQDSARDERGESAPGKEDTQESGRESDENLGVESESASSEEKSTGIDQSESGQTGGEESGDSETEGSSRRRRRRRRRRSSGETAGETISEDDPPNTVIHEREPRNKSRTKDEVQGITGSTRLEAKRQRRRDGRDAGRRRPPILSESEFLARREAVDRVMIVRDRIAAGRPGATTQVAVLEDGVLVEHFVTTSTSASMVGNVYLGRVQNVLPSMEAAFIDIGRGRNGVLYAGEVNWDAAGLGGNSRKIEQALKPGDQVLVQVSKDPIGHKGARLTTQISLAGRFLVFVPGGTSTGISRKLPDTERKRLKDVLREIVPPDAGVIIRTASEGVSEQELARDITRLQEQWARIEEQAEKAKAGKSGNPQALYEEPDLLVKVIRDLFNEDFSKLVIEGEKAWTTVESYIASVAPDLLPRLEQHSATNGGIDVFEAHRIDEQLAKALDRKVWLPSGGTLVIDRTEAMTVVDVNTGKFTGAGGNLEETVTRNNLEAAEEIVRQMRLRDIGGMIVVDFIDMVLESNRDLVLRRLTEALGRDRTRHQVSEVTSLGLVQMTRKKLGTGLVEAFSSNCEHCHGRGIILHADPIEVKSSVDDGSRGPSRGDSGGSRRKRGRGKSSDGESSPPSVTEDAQAVDATAKRAHPVALAMAHHHQEEATAVADAKLDESPRTGDVPAPETLERPEDSQELVQSAEAPLASDQAESEEPAVETPEPLAEPEPEPVIESESEPVIESEPKPAVPSRRRSRRVSRAAAAPKIETASAGTVFVIPKPETEVGGTPGTESAISATTVGEPPSYAHDGAEARPIPRRTRRRAAARPAGPPVEADH